jgi:hypothetical protein
MLKLFSYVNYVEFSKLLPTIQKYKNVFKTEEIITSLKLKLVVLSFHAQYYISEIHDSLIRNKRLLEVK